MAPFIYKEDPKTGSRWWRCDCPEPCVVYQCVKRRGKKRCKRTWRSYADFTTQCSCGSFYVKWVNYVAWRKKHPLAQPFMEGDQ